MTNLCAVPQPGIREYWICKNYEHVYSQIGATLQFFYTVYELPSTYIYIYIGHLWVCPMFPRSAAYLGWVGGGGVRTVKNYLHFKMYY